MITLKIFTLQWNRRSVAAFQTGNVGPMFVWSWWTVHWWTALTQHQTNIGLTPSLADKNRGKRWRLLAVETKRLFFQDDDISFQIGWLAPWWADARDVGPTLSQHCAIIYLVGTWTPCHPNVEQDCSAKPKGSSCSLSKWAATAFRLCTAWQSEGGVGVRVAWWGTCVGCIYYDK